MLYAGIFERLDPSRSCQSVGTHVNCYIEYGDRVQLDTISGTGFDIRK